MTRGETGDERIGSGPIGAGITGDGIMLDRRWPLRLASFLVAAIVALPLVVVVSFWLQPEPEIWAHLRAHVLPGLITNSVLLLGGVLLLAGGLGISLAWLTAAYRFPASRWLRWLLMLPLAFPAYVLAFVQVGLLDYTGPVQTGLRQLVGGPVDFPQIRSVGGAVLVLSLCFYPYVFLLARNAFDRQGRQAMETAQSLGLSPAAGFFRVVLPLARPWIVSGLLLVMMETLADFGAVYILGVDTFTTAIYKSWFSLFSLSAANQLAAILVLFALVMMLAEQHQRGRRRYADASAGLDRVPPRLRGWRAWAAFGYAGMVLLLAVFIPLLQLLVWAWPQLALESDLRYFGYLGRSLTLAALAAVLVTTLGLLLAYAQRRLDDRLAAWTVAVASAGYAIPGVVLAVGVFITLNALGQLLAAWGIGSGAGWATGTIIAMLLALSARFLSVAIAPAGSGLQRISPALEHSARSLGAAGFTLLRRVHLPLLRASLATAALLVFVDVMKEMPITLMTRPFGWDTLSVRLFELTSEGEWRRAALPAITLVLTGLVPVVLLGRIRAIR